MTSSVRRVFTAGSLGLVTGVACGFGGCAGAILPDAMHMSGDPPPAPADAIVVLGNRPSLGDDGEIAPELRRRVERGVELYRQGLAPRLVLTGGPAGDGVVEAEVAARHARALGVPASALVLEVESQDTIGNVTGAMERLCPRGSGASSCHPRLLVVSSPYHLERARWLFECAGAEAVLAGTEIPDDSSYRISFVIRELVVRLYYLHVDYCARAAGRPDAPDYSRIW
jgi:uncharacterized SAM-binding protein YcdF (DUF218 family)